MRAARFVLLLLAWWGGLVSTWSQVDSTQRELFQAGYNAPLEGRGPLSGYAFYFLNQPDFPRTNWTLRLAVAPVYLDSEVGIKQALGPRTDLGLGLAGGGFADSYSEVRRGLFERDESFTGHGGGAAASLYHRFNPGEKIPLYAVLRGEAYWATYSEDSDTARNFLLPEDHASFSVRSGLRWGGREPLILPEMAMELSVWYEGQFRTEAGAYGFDGDRRLRFDAHLFWGRALLAYTLPKCQHNFNVSLTVGTALHPDRFSAYRLGGLLPMAGEFPLNLPGYYYQELSAHRFGLLGLSYAVPLDSKQRWTVHATAATAWVDYLRGLEQPGLWHTGVGAGLGYHSPSDTWRIVAGYAYGIDAMRSHGRGGHSVGTLLQFDLERAKGILHDPGEGPDRSRGLHRFLGRLLRL